MENIITKTQNRFTLESCDQEKFNRAIRDKGWVYFDSVLEESFVDRLREELDEAYKMRRQVQVKNGIDVNTDGTAHHLLGYKDSFYEFLERAYFDDYMKSYFNGNYIINTYGGVINMKDKPSYVCRIHRDVRTYVESVNIMGNMLIMLDDFTLDNGATYVLSESHLDERQPGDEEFFANSERITGKKGTIVFWDSNLWHAAGQNQTDQLRRCLTITWTVPYIKQQFDYPRAIGYDKLPGLSEHLKQVIGYNSRVPSTLDEWYQPPEKRFYKPGQG